VIQQKGMEGVRNAGYGQFAPFEQMSAEDFQAVVDTCFYGVV
jgi:hypothetical protein